jgi:putative spermidine/putrescine transport system ATP-binding protein
VSVLGQEIAAEDPGGHAVGSEVDVLVRPEVVEVREGGDDGRLRTRTFLGAVTRVNVAMTDGTELLADAPSHLAPTTPGAPVAVRLVADRVLVADRTT